MKPRECVHCGSDLTEQISVYHDPRSAVKEIRMWCNGCARSFTVFVKVEP